MSWMNEDVRDEIYEQDEEEDEGPSWVDDKGKILEAAFCEYFLEMHSLMCIPHDVHSPNPAFAARRLHKFHRMKYGQHFVILLK